MPSTETKKTDPNIQLDIMVSKSIENKLNILSIADKTIKQTPYKRKKYRTKEQ